MTLNEFIQLQNKKKISLLYEQGVYIGKRKIDGASVILFQLEGFYAEVFYRTYRRHISKINCFADTGRLDPYLTEIKVAHLV